MISQITPAARRPASRHRSTMPSVWPARTSTPPSRARSGAMWPGRTTSCGLASGLTAARIVVARSLAEMPVVTPSRASIVTVNAVPKRDWFSGTCICNPIWSHISPDIARQTQPRHSLIIRLINSGVAN
jgi:hypothetical protein